MAVGIDAQYGPGKAAAPSAGYPFGSGRNISTPSDGTGTPYEAAWFNDYVGYFSGLLDEVGDVPSGNPDTTLIGQYRDAMKKSRSHVDVKAFGATGDGATDDTTAIQAAIDFAASADGKSGVLFTKGTYLTDKLSVPSRITLTSVGGILKLNDAQNSAIIEIPVGAQYVSLEHLELDGNDINNGSTPVTVGLVTVLSSAGSPTSDVWIEKCQIHSANQNSIYLNDGARFIWINQCRINGALNGSCIVISPLTATTQKLSITNCTITAAVKSRIRADGIVLGAVISHNFIDGGAGDAASAEILARDAANRDFVIDGNVCTTSAAFGIYVGGSSMAISNNVIRDHNDTGILLGALLNAQCEFCTITGNTVEGGVSARFGIAAINAFGVVITGNIVDFGSDVGIQVQNVGAAELANRFAISGNSVNDVTVYGIRVAGGVRVRNGALVGNVVSGVNPNVTVAGIQLEDCEDITISANHSSDHQAGINEQAPSNFNVFVGNNVRGNTVGIVKTGVGSIQSANLS